MSDRASLPDTPTIAQKQAAVSSVVRGARSLGWIAAGVAFGGVSFFLGRGLHWS